MHALKCTIIIVIIAVLWLPLSKSESRYKCPLGFVRGKHTGNCLAVSWSSWSSWTTCISTEWGGLTTRSRLCERRGHSYNGFCVGHGSEHKSCSTVTQKTRIRKNVRLLSAEEQHDLIQAMTKFKKDRSPKGYVAIVRYHGWPYECPWLKHVPGHSDGHCSFHNSVLFFPWHRIFVVQLELGINRYMRNKTLGLPYWDWTEPWWTDVPLLFRNPRVFDPVLQKYVHNPFYTTQLFGHRKYKGKTVFTHRNVSHTGIHQWQKYLASTTIALEMESFKNFDSTLEDNGHAQIHYCSCKTMNGGLCDFSMPTTTYSAWDPLFILHHGMVDRIFALRKALGEARGAQDWTAHRIMGSYYGTARKLSIFKEPLYPFINDTINPFIQTRRENVWTTEFGYYYENVFGYKYDNLNLGNRDWKLMVKDLNEKYSTLNEKGWRKDTSSFHSSFYPEYGLITNTNCIFSVNYCNGYPIKS